MNDEKQGSAAERCAQELESAGWPSVAEDIRDGVSPATVARRLREIGAGDSEAYNIVAYVMGSAGYSL